MRERAKKVLLNNVSFYVYGIFFVFIIWWFLSYLIGGGGFTFPSPINTFKEFFGLLSAVYIWKSIGMSLFRTLLGFLIALFLSVVLGFIVGANKKAQTFLKPLFSVLKSAPSAAFVFLFLLLLGSEYAPIAIAVLLSFPILYESIIGGMNSLSEEVKMAMRLDSGNKARNFFKIRLPIALPYLMVGIASSFALSLKTTIMAEIITGSTSYGLGSAINYYRTLNPGDMTPIFAIALIAIFLIMFFDLIGYAIKKIFVH